MVQIIEEESVGGRLGSALGAGISSGLDLLIQSKVNRMQQRQQALGELFKQQEAVQSNISKFLKDIGSSDVFDPDERLKMGELARSNMENGMAPSMAILNAYQQLNEQAEAEEELDRQKPSAQRSGLISKSPEERKKFLQDMREERQKAYEEGPSPVQMPGAFARGAVESPILNLLRQMGTPETAAFDVAKGGLKRLVEPSYTFEEEETEKGKKTRELGRGIGDIAALELVPFAEALKPFAPYVRRAFGNVASRFGKSAPEIAKSFEKFIQREGVDLSKLAKRDVNESRKFLKATRAFEENYPQISKELESRQALQKASKRKGVTEEASKEAERKAKSLLRDEPKTDVGRARRESVKQEAKKDLDAAKDKYIEATKRRRRIEDDLKLDKEGVTKSDLERAKVLEKEAKERLGRLQKEARIGKKQPTVYEQERTLFNTLNEVKSIAEDASVPLEKQFKPLKDRFAKGKEFQQEVKDALRKKELPPVAKDEFIRQQERYADRIMKRLKDVQQDLGSTKNIQEALARRREIEMLRDLLDIQKNKIKLGERRKSLQRIDKLMNETKKFMEQEKLSKESLKSAQKANEEYANKLQKVMKKIEDAPKSEAKDIIDKESTDLGKIKLKWPNWKTIIRNATKGKLEIDNKLINAALTGLGIHQSLSPKGVLSLIQNLNQQSKMKKKLKNPRQLQNYINELKSKGYSNSRIKKNLEKARKAV